jgi:hypothetical protein
MVLLSTHLSGALMSVTLTTGRTITVAITASAALLLAGALAATGPSAVASPRPCGTPRPGTPPELIECRRVPAVPLASGAALAEVRLDRRGYVETYVSDSASPFWAIVATVSTSPTFDADLTAEQDHEDSPPPGQVNFNLNSSQKDSLPGHTLEWVAMDHNGGRHRRGPFFTDIRAGWAPAGSETEPAAYRVQYVHARSVLGTKKPTVDQPVGFAEPWLVDIRDVNLVAGTRYTFQGKGAAAMHLLRSSVADTETWTHARSESGLPEHHLRAGADGKLVYTAPATGWYAVVIEAKPVPGAPTVRITIG